jgi:hypothetical protein
MISALEEVEDRVLVCLSRDDGRLLWQRTIVHSPLEGKHPFNSYASGTPATDGQSVYTAVLDGAEMVVDRRSLDGEPLWSVRPGEFSSKHGFCSSPVLFENLVIVNGDHDGAAYVVALDAATGETVWKTPRENETRSYSTPIIRQIDGRTQMLLTGNKCVASYDPRDGSRHWIFDGPTEQFVATVLYHQGLVLVTCGFPERHLVAIRPDGSGNVTDTHVEWHEQKGAAYVPSPVALDDYFVVVNDAGIANCFIAKTGERLWTERIGPRYESSLITAGGLVYITSYEGETTVVRPGPEYDEVARNELGEYCSSSAAVSGGRIYLRTEQHLWAIEAE